MLTSLPVGPDEGYAVVVDASVIMGDFETGSIVRYSLNTASADATPARPDPARLKATRV